MSVVGTTDTAAAAPPLRRRAELAGGPPDRRHHVALEPFAGQVTTDASSTAATALYATARQPAVWAVRAPGAPVRGGRAIRGPRPGRRG